MPGSNPRTRSARCAGAAAAFARGMNFSRWPEAHGHTNEGPGRRHGNLDHPRPRAPAGRQSSGRTPASGPATAAGRPAARSGPGPVGPIRFRGASRYQACLASTVCRGGPAIPGTQAGVAHRPRAVGVRDGDRRSWTVLLSGRREAIHRPVVPRATSEQTRRPRRLRPGLRHRSRGRPPRAEPARHFRQGQRASRPSGRGRVQPDVGADGIAGRFLCQGWAHHAKKARDLLEQGDIEEAIGAAEAIGYDRLQRKSQGYLVPDSFTHGTSEQRVRWFRRGFETGDMEQGDTFNAERL